MRARLFFATVILLAMAAIAVSQEKQERVRIPLQRMQPGQTSVSLQPSEKVICVGSSAFQPVLSGSYFWDYNGIPVGGRPVRVVANRQVLDFYSRSGWALSMDTYPDGMLYVQFTAPVILPHNARITRLILLCYDNSSDENKEVSLLLRYAENTSLGARNVCRVASSEAADRVRLFQTTDMTEDLVDNVNAVYWLELSLMGGTREFKFGQAKIYYREE